MKFDESSTGLPAGMGLLHKVVNGRAYTWDFEWDKSSSSYYYDWFPAEYGRENSIWVYVYENQISSGDGLITELQPLNQVDRNRPENVKIPESQDAILPILFGKEEIKVPITISYALNPDYRPFDPNIGPDSAGEEIIYIPLISCFVLITAILLFATWNNMRHVKS